MDSHAANTIRTADATDEQDLWKRLANRRYSMLTTHDADGSLGARPVTALKVESDGRLWFFIPATGGIAADIEGDPRVHLCYMNEDDDLFVSLRGKGTVLRDPGKARELWSTMAGAWFPGGPEDPSLAILRVDVDRGDYWDVKSSKLVQFFEMAKAALLKKTPENFGDHKRFTPMYEPK